MRLPWLPFMLALCASIAGTDSAQAQIERHNLRLFLEGGLVEWSKAQVEYKGLDENVEQTATARGTGVLTAGGVGAGLAATRYLVPTLSFSMQRVKLDGEGTARDLRSWELRPALEVPLLPSIRFVPFVSVGISLMRSVDKGAAPAQFEDVDEHGDLKHFGWGPVLQAGLHTFVFEHASLDLSLAYRALFNFIWPAPTWDEEGNFSAPRRSVMHSLLLNLGASFWLL